MDDQEETSKCLSKIDCNNPSGLLTMVQLIKDKLEQFNKQTNEDAAGRDDLNKDAVQAVQSTLLSNVLVHGQPITGIEQDLNGKQGSEDIARIQEENSQQDLINDWYKQMVATTTFRKKAPKHIQSNMKKVIRCELKHTLTSIVKLGSGNTEEEAMETDSTGATMSSPSLDEVQHRLQAVTQTWKSLSQNSNDMEKTVLDLTRVSKRLAKTVGPCTETIYGSKMDKNANIFDSQNILYDTLLR